jgi:hypothetical protein
MLITEKKLRQIIQEELTLLFEKKKKKKKRKTKLKDVEEINTVANVGSFGWSVPLGYGPKRDKKFIRKQANFFGGAKPMHEN